MSQVFLLITLISVVACSKKSGESVSPKLKSYEFIGLNGVPAFASLNLNKSSFVIASNTLGEMQFDMRHVTKAKFNDREALFTGEVKMINTGMVGKAYMYDGIGGIQIGMDFVHPSNGLKRYQIRNVTSMHESYKEIEGNPNYLKGTMYTQSVRNEMKVQGIPESETSRIILEENGEYELIDLSALAEISAQLHPASSVRQGGPEVLSAPDASNSKRAIVKSNWVVFTTYTLNGNPFGEYSYNRYVDACANTYRTFDEVDPLNTMNYVFFSFSIDTKAGGVQLVWNTNSVTFLENWQKLHDALGYFPDYWEAKCVNALSVGNSWSDAYGNSYSNTFGDRKYNVCVVSSNVNSPNPYIEAHNISKLFGATIDNTVYSTSNIIPGAVIGTSTQNSLVNTSGSGSTINNGSTLTGTSTGATTNSGSSTGNGTGVGGSTPTKYQDVMCDIKSAVIVNTHVNKVNRGNIQRYFIGY